MSIWEEVKNRIAIEEVIGEYVQLTPVGQNYRCLSPFRQERTPSLIVSPSKKFGTILARARVETCLNLWLE